MNKLGGLLLGGIVLVTTHNMFGQSAVETALMFSRTSNGGSARILGMGGASASLGGDFSAATSNPAGLGMFNRSEFSISPGYSYAGAESTYFDNITKGRKTNLAVPALSFVFHSEKSKFISGSFAITLTRMNSFHSNLTYEGVNEHNAISDYFANNSLGIDPNSFTQDDMSLNRLAYDNYLLDWYYDTNNNVYFYGSAAGSNIFDENDVPRSTQRETKISRGAQNQWSASYGVNIDDKFFLGAGLHLRSIRYENKSNYGESDFSFVNAGPGYDPINTISLEENLKISGSGFSVTLGGIMRPMDGLQIGVAYNSPTVYTMRDVYSATLATDWNNFDYYGDGSVILDKLEYATDDVVAEYQLRTPGRLSMGGTYFFEKAGFLTADFEFLNFTKARYSDNEDFEIDNDRIQSLYQPTVNFKLGGEYRLNDYRFRAGMAFLGEPFDERQNGISRAINSFSVGAGYRKESFYVDVALQLMGGDNSYRPYSVPGDFSPLVESSHRMTNFMVTVGIPFQ